MVNAERESILANIFDKKPSTDIRDKEITDTKIKEKKIFSRLIDDLLRFGDHVGTKQESIAAKTKKGEFYEMLKNIFPSDENFAMLFKKILENDAGSLDLLLVDYNDMQIQLILALFARYRLGRILRNAEVHFNPNGEKAEPLNLAMKHIIVMYKKRMTARHIELFRSWTGNDISRERVSELARMIMAEHNRK